MGPASSQSRFVPVNGTDYYVEESGSGHPLVLLHSGLTNLRMWDAQIPALAERYRVIRYDLPGFGKSGTPKGAFSTRADLAGLLRHLGVERAHVVGISLGGSLAIDFTLEYPELVSALVVVAPSLSGRPLSPTQIAAFRDVDEAEEAQDWDRVNELEVQHWVDGLGQPPTRVPAEVRDFVLRLNRENLLRPEGDAQPIQLNPPAVGRLGEIRAPTLVVVGDLDLSDKLAIADEIEAGVPGARKIVLPGVAHLVNLERPDEFNRILLDFLH